MAKELYGGPVTKHQELAQTGHAEGYAKGGSTHSRNSGGHTSMKSHNVGHGHHGHKGPHEHHTSPGHGHSGHKGHSVHSLVSGGKNTAESVSSTHTDGIETDGGGRHHSGSSAGHSTGGTRNRI